MVKLANIAIYPLPFITREKLQKFSSKLKQLEEETDTTIIYDYEDQVFNIEGESQEGCDIVEENILFSLIPLLSNDIDKTCMTGTYEELSFIEGKVPVASFNIVNVEGRSLKDQEDDMEHDEEVIIEKEPEDVQFIIKEFHISPRITNIQAFIIGPPQFNMQLAEYLEIIPRMTNTDCVQLGRCIRITGEESCVDDAIDKFRVIQNSHIAHLEVDYVMCIHYPKHSGPYGLCFCDLNRYKQKEFVIDQLDPHQVLEDIYVMLPVFIDPFTNEYARPKDLIQIKAPAQKKYQQMAEEEYRERDKLKRKEINDAFAMLNVKPVIETKSNQSHKYYVQYSEPHYNTSSPTLTGKIPMDTNSTEFIGSLENHHTASASSSAPIRRPNYVKNNTRDSTKEVLKSESTDEEPLSVYEYEVQKLPENTEEHFPSLSPSPVSRSSTPINGRRPKGLYKPTLGNDEPKKNRVIRIVPQKSYRSRSPTPSLSLVERVKEYNYHNIKNVLEKGLDSIRGFKGEIRLSAKIGKVFWTDVPAEIKGQIWRYEDINDILIKEHNFKPQFTRATARDQFILECMTSENILPSPAYNKTSTYEFHCLARNQPIVPFRPVVIHMNEGVINVKKVVLREKVVSKVDWVSLDRKYDFELSLSTKVLARTDVKPYSTFIKRVSICPITCLMTFENVPKFLSVEFLLLKVTARFRIDHPFIIEITRVEKVPIKPVAGTVKIDASPGEGEFWYDFEIRNTETDVSFEKNKDLEIGDEAPWTAKDILDLADGDHAKADNITKHVQNILNVIEKIEREIGGK